MSGGKPHHSANAVVEGGLLAVADHDHAPADGNDTALSSMSGPGEQ